MQMEFSAARRLGTATRKSSRMSFAAWIWTKRLHCQPPSQWDPSRIESSGRRKRMRVPLLDLKAQYQSVQDEVEAAIFNVLNSQQFILGPKVTECEEAI